MRNLTGAEIRSLLHHRMLLERLRQAFRSGAEVAEPVSLHLDTRQRLDSEMRVEPVWQPGRAFGISIAGRFPHNPEHDVAAQQGVFVLVDGKTGIPQATLDGPALARRCGAVASALAATYLARNDAARLLVVGTGSLALEVIEAYTQLLPIKHVLVWGRRADKAKRIVARFHRPKFRLETTDDLEGAVRGADIVACVTSSGQPLIKGEWLREGCHLDLLGGTAPDMREADDDCLHRARVFVDTRERACHLAGDLAKPLAAGVLSPDDIAGDLFDLTRGDRAGRRFYDQITLFKAVGTPLEDLAAAQIAVEMAIHNDTIR